MPAHLEERDWNFLLQTIKAGKCTAFLGAGVCAGVLPSASEVAREWALEYNYPLNDYNDLVRVAQFLSVHYDPIFAKEALLYRWYRNADAPDFGAYDEPHGVMADLPLSIYITTNYDDFMVQALKSRNRNPERELCRWNEHLKSLPSVFESDPVFNPTPENPAVFHLHGHNEVPESLVLTENDHLDFLWNASREPDLLPDRIRKALATTSLLFIGYSLTDWSFRVLYRGILRSTHSSIRRTSFAVRLPPVSGAQQEAAQGYLEKYLHDMDARIYWGTAREFAAELRERWVASGFAETFKREDQMKAAAQIFLSYAREDEEEVEELYQKLSVAGFKPWMGKKDVVPGEKWPSAIRRAIRDSDFFLVCLSANSVKKRGWVQREMKQALDLWQEKLEDDIYLIPVRLEDCEAPESLREFQWVNLFEADGWAQLEKAIQVGVERRSDQSS